MELLHGKPPFCAWCMFPTEPCKNSLHLPEPRPETLLLIKHIICLLQKPQAVKLSAFTQQRPHHLPASDMRLHTTATKCETTCTHIHILRPAATNIATTPACSVLAHQPQCSGIRHTQKLRSASHRPNTIHPARCLWLPVLCWGCSATTNHIPLSQVKVKQQLNCY